MQLRRSWQGFLNDAGQHHTEMQHRDTMGEVAPVVRELAGLYMQQAQSRWRQRGRGGRDCRACDRGGNQPCLQAPPGSSARGHGFGEKCDESSRRLVFSPWLRTSHSSISSWPSRVPTGVEFRVGRSCRARPHSSRNMGHDAAGGHAVGWGCAVDRPAGGVVLARGGCAFPFPAAARCRTRPGFGDAANFESFLTGDASMR